MFSQSISDPDLDVKVKKGMMFKSGCYLDLYLIPDYNSTCQIQLNYKQKIKIYFPLSSLRSQRKPEIRPFSEPELQK